MSNTAETTLSARQVAFRAARREKQAQIQAPVVRALFGPAVNAQYYTNSKGWKCLDEKATPSTRDDLMELLVGNRVVDERDLFERVGPNFTAYMISKGYLRRSPCAYQRHILWITEDCAANYDLKPVRLEGGTPVAWAK